MTDEKNPFSSWKEEHAASEASSLAKTLKALMQEEHRARINLNEALSYYSSGGWQQQNVKLERLNELIAELRSAHQQRLSLKAAAESQLVRVLQGSQSITGTESIEERRKQLINAAPAPTADEDIEPSPLEEFIALQSPAIRRRRRRSIKL